MSPCSDLVDEDLRSPGAEQQDGPPQSVPVPVQLLGPHAGEQAGEHAADVPVHPLQGHVQTQPRRLVQEALQAADVCRGQTHRDT